MLTYLTYLFGLFRHAFTAVYYAIYDVMYGAKCLTKGCECDYYSDWHTFDALSRQAHDIFYAQRIVESGIIGTPLKCDKCSCPRECHERLDARNLEPQYMPNGGAVAIEQAKKDRAERMRRRFSSNNTNTKGEKLPSLVWEDLHIDNSTSSATVQLDSYITVSYIASFQSDNKEFETNNKFSFKVGKGDAMRGFDAGVRGMKVNGIRKISIPPHLAYGAKHQVDGRTGETLVFTVKVVACT